MDVETASQVGGKTHSKPAFVIPVIGKGGDGKTTTTASLGDALARTRGLQVLLVDLDSQASLTTWLVGFPEGPTIDGFLAGEVRELADVVVPVRAGDASSGRVDLAPANGMELANLDPLAVPEGIGALQAQASALGYDVVLIDTHSFSPQGEDELTLHTPVMGIADMVILAFQPSSMSSLALFNVMQFFRDCLPGRADLPLRILPTRTPRTRSALDALADLKERWKDDVLKHVSARVAADDAVAAGQLLHEYAPTSQPAKDYLAVAEQIEVPA